VSPRYLIRPKADQDLEDQAFYLSTHTSPQIGHRFLVAAHDCFTRLAVQPGIGWQPRLRSSELTNVRIFSISGFEKILVFYRPIRKGVEILRVVHGSRNLLKFLQTHGLE
jgi:plasmid stabilization system protein ParE